MNDNPAVTDALNEFDGNSSAGNPLDVLTGQFSGANTVSWNRAYSVQAETTIVATAQAVRAEFTAIEGVSVGTAGGSDHVTIFDAPASATTSLTINTGINSDTVLMMDLSPSTTVSLGAGDDVAELRTDSGGTVTVDGGTGSDTIGVFRVGATTSAFLHGGDDADLFLVQGSNVPLGSATTIEGDDPTSSPGDVLRFDAGGGVVSPGDTGSSGSIGVQGRGQVDFSEIESVEIVAAPIITPTSVPVITEGDDLNLTVVVQALGSGNTLNGPVLWQINNSAFGAVTGTTIHLTWNQLKNDFGIDDGDATYQLAVRATNADNFTTTEIITLTVLNAAPSIEMTASPAGTVNTDFGLQAVHSDDGHDRALSWLVSWGDSSSSLFGAASGITSSHQYSEPGTYTVTVTVVDEDSNPLAAATTSHEVVISVDPSSVSAGGPYAIAEGEELTLSAYVAGTPVSIGWDLNNDQDFTDAVGLNPSALSWLTLESLGIDNSATALPVAVRVTYGNGQILVATTQLAISNTDPVASFGNNVPTGGVDEGAAFGTVVVSFSNQADPAAGDTAAGFTYSFDFGNTGSFDITNQTGSFASVPALWPGDGGFVTVRGRITDQDGGYSEYLTTFRISEVLPVFNLNGASAAFEGDTYQLNLTDLFDPGVGDSPTSLQVDWGDGSPLESFLPDATTFLHTFADNQSGQTTIRVIATDADGSVERSLLTSVSNVAPVLSNIFAGLVGGAGPIVEGDEIRFSGSIADPGVLDVFSLAIDWGDGLQETISVPAGATGFAVGHVYVNDGTFSVAATLSDDDGGFDVTAVQVVVRNAAPQVSAWLTRDDITETGSTTLSGIIVDRGLADTHLVTVDWGDGSAAEAATVTNRTFTISHTYADDAPTGTSVDSFFVVVSVVDNADADSQSSTSVGLLVHNAAPQITSSGTNAFDLPHAILPGATAVLTAEFLDIGKDDSHTVTIDWGDGTIETGIVPTFSPATGLGSVTADHIYVSDGRYDIQLTVIDDDLDVSSVGTAIAIVATPGANSPPIVDDQVFSIDENSAAGAFAGSVVAADPDQNDSLTYSLDDTNFFTIDSSTGLITVADFAVLNYEYQSTYTLQVTVSDAIGASDTAVVTINLNDVNEFAPRLDSTDFILNPNAVNGTVLGMVTATDDDGNDRLLFSLASGSPFAIDSTTGRLQLVDSSLLDFSRSPRILVPVTVTDQGGLTDSGFVVVSAGVTPNAAPSGADKTLTMSQDTQLLIAASDFGFSDSDGNLFNRVRIATLPGAGILKLNGTNVSAGDFITKTDLDAGKLTFEPAAGASGTPYSTFTFQVEDDGGTENMGVNLDQSPNTITINVTAILATPPVLAGIESTPLPYAPGAAASVITSKLTVTDPDSANLVGARVQIAAGYVFGDWLGFTNTATITGVYDSVSATLTLTGSDTVAHYEAALRSVTFVGSTRTPAVRIVSFTVSDGTDDSNVVVREVGGYAQLIGTTLNVYGTTQSDVITVSEPAATLTVVVNSFSATYSAVSVTAINIYGSGGGGPDVLDGGGGNDTLNGRGDADTLIGGDGNDRLLFNNLDTSSSGGNGTDTAVLTGATAAISLDLVATGIEIVNAASSSFDNTLIATGATRPVKITGGSGDDIIIGGTKNDKLYGGDGNDVLVGGGGNDQLFGGSGKNILIGGDGSDRLTGGTDEDLLLGARYLGENNVTELNALRAEWTSASSFENRVDHLSGTLVGGLNGTTVLNPGTVREDRAKDTLIGDSGRDWYFRNSLGAIANKRDVVTDLDLDSVFAEIDTWL